MKPDTDVTGTIPPIIWNVPDNDAGLARLEAASEDEPTDERQIMLHYPTVYIHNCPESDQYDVYVGETNDILQRTRQHFEASRISGAWQSHVINQKGSSLYVIGHPHFNKSLTLDVENRLMHYFLGVEKVRKIYNARGNAQDSYYTVNEFDPIFDRIWEELRSRNEALFPPKDVIEDTAVFKASPFHKLTADQLHDRDEILSIIYDAIAQDATGQLVFVSGEAGTGKTVLNSNLFYELCLARKPDHTPYNVHLLVNHDQQLIVYQQIAVKLQLRSVDETFISKPTTFINHHSETAPVDIVLVDEAHLLWSQGKQSYRGHNMIEDLRRRARVVVLMFDEHQMLHTQEYWDPAYVKALKDEAKGETYDRLKSYYFELRNQLRIHGNAATVHWIRNFTDRLRIGNIPPDDQYEIRIFDTPGEMEQAIRKKAADKDTALSRMLATFDWKYVDAKKPDHEDYWYVRIGGWQMPWNMQLEPSDTRERKKYKGLSWAERDYTVNEVGSTFTIQGFDLNYAGVILGPSVTYRNGQIVIDPSKSQDAKATNQRTLPDGEKKSFGEQFIRNEINVLLTRGVNGLYLYAVDDNLREALKNARLGKLDQ